MSVCGLAHATVMPAPNESTVTAYVSDASIVDATTLDMQPSQPICVLTLEIQFVKNDPNELAAIIKTTDKTMRVYTKDLSLTRLKNVIIVATIENSGSNKFWLTSFEVI